MDEQLTERLATAARRELALTLSALCAEVGAAESSILLPADDTHLMFFASSNPALMQPDVPLVPINASFSGIAFRTGQTFAVADAASDKQHYKAIDERVASRTREFAAIPCAEHSVLGVLTLVNRAKRDGDDAAPFSIAEIRQAESFATGIAHTIGLMPGLIGMGARDTDHMQALEPDFVADLTSLTQAERRIVQGLVNALIENRGE
jgi:GAF domain-containing protein